MPKIVDHEKRRKMIAEATWRVICEHGMEGATVRKIAKEAGMSLGALQHYFTNQNELLSYAMKLVQERAAIRINQIAEQDIPIKEKVVNILLETIPTNKETMTEVHVWFEFIVYIRNKPDVFKRQNDGILSSMRNFIHILDEQQFLKNGLNKEVEAEKLYAIIDGLALHAMLEPERLNREFIKIVLTDHVERILK